MRLIRTGQGDYTRDTDGLGAGAVVLAAFLVFFVLCLVMGW